MKRKKACFVACLVTAETEKKLKQKAAKDGRTVSAFVRRLIESAVKR